MVIPVCSKDKDALDDLECGEDSVEGRTDDSEVWTSHCTILDDPSECVAPPSKQERQDHCKEDGAAETDDPGSGEIDLSGALLA